MPQPGGLTQQSFIAHSPGGWVVQDQGEIFYCNISFTEFKLCPNCIHQKIKVCPCLMLNSKPLASKLCAVSFSMV